MRNSICAIIVTFNCDSHFINTFNSIYPQVTHIVIIDNGSNKETVSMLNLIASNKNVDVIFFKENLGIAKALNEGVKFALSHHYEWIITLDHDSIADKNMIKTMFDSYYSLPIEEQNKLLSFGPDFIELGYGSNEINNHNKHGVEYQTTIICSGNIIHHSIFDIVGFFDENLFIDRVDDDFCFRIQQSGFRIAKMNDAILFHKIGNTELRHFLFITGTPTNHSPIRRYYITRNRIYCWKKYGKYFHTYIKNDKINFIKETAKIILFEKDKFLKIRMIIRGIRDAYRNRYGKISSTYY